MRARLWSTIGLLLVLGGGLAWYLLTPARLPDGHAATVVRVLAGSGADGWRDGAAAEARFSEPFGITALADGSVVVSDAGASHRIRRISPDGIVSTLSGGGRGFADGGPGTARFSTPSGIAVGPDGAFYVADTGNHAIRRVSRDGTVTTVAGDGTAGHADGPGVLARFNGPVGVAVDASGRVLVAHTYNDLIRVIDTDGQVRTLAGGDEPGYADGPAAVARFDTPCGIAVGPDGLVVVADTGNGAIRTVAGDGTVGTVAGASAPGFTSPAVPILGLDRPIAVAADAHGHIYVADERGDILMLPAEGEARLLAGAGQGFANGVGREAMFRRPSGIAVSGHPLPPEGGAARHATSGRQDAARIAPLVVADAGNALLRSLDPAHTVAQRQGVRRIDRLLTRPSFVPPYPPGVAPAFDAEAFARVPLLWPVAPLDGPHEVAGTFAEARGEEGQERFHAGLDVRRPEGTLVHAVRDGIVASPVSAGAFGTINEWMRVGTVTYIHIRVGRRADGGRRSPDARTARNAATQRGWPLPDADSSRFAPVFDADGTMTRMRVKRGAAFATGDVVGSVNRFNHVHLNVGWPGEEHNPLQFRLVQFADTIRPTIAAHGVRLFDEAWQPLNPDRAVPVPARRGRKGRTQQLPPATPVTVHGRVRIVVDAWDQAEGNVPSRRLGLYALGYRVLDRHGTPVPGFEGDDATIRFDALRRDSDAASAVFASGSGIPVYGARRTRFLYVVTTRFRDGVAAPGWWDTSSLAPGEYVLQVYGEDYHGNRTTRDLPVLVGIR